MNKDTNIWESRYQAGTTGWDRGAASQNLQFWLEQGLLKPCRILVPGCGNGYEVLTLAKKRFEVVAIDIAPTAIANLQKALAAENLNAEVLLADFFTYQPEEKFDAIFEQTSLCALPPKEWEMYAGQLHAWLTPQGKLFAQFMQTGQEGGPPFHCELNDMKVLFPQTAWNWSEEYSVQTKEPGKTERLFMIDKK